MGIKLTLPDVTELRPRITVIGVGGAGNNAVNNMIASGIQGVDFVAANTDAQSLAMSAAPHKIQLGVNLTEGLGAGSKPEIGEASAEEAIEEIRSRLAGSHMVFIAAGMGGGTGTGAAAVIARCARELGILTVAIVTKPFHFEGNRRMRVAEAGIAEIGKHADTLIVIPNQNLFRVANEKTTFAEAFLMADQVLHSGIACVTDLIVKEGLINLDFADVRTVMSGMGPAIMGTGTGSGERRAVQAAEQAILNPLLDDISLRGAKGLLISISGNRNLTLYEVDEAASRIRQEVDPEANIIVGATFDETLGDRVRVSIVASGLAVAASHPSNAREGWRGGWHQNGQETGPAAPRRETPAVTNAPEVTRRLSEALEASATRESVLEARHEAPPAPAEEIWEGPGDVVIELGAPKIALGSERVSPLPAHDLSDRAESTDDDTDQSDFVPARPSEIRRPPRRMPEVEDFPEIGQREYGAKRGGGPGAEQFSGEKRRASLFARLTGRHHDDESTESGPLPRVLTGRGGETHAADHGAPQRGGVMQNRHASREAHSDRRREETEKPHEKTGFFRGRGS